MSVLTELKGDGLLIIQLNRPDKLNALNHQVLSELSTHFSQAEQDPQVKGILLTGTGKAFCAGADINRLAECDATLGYEFAVEGQRVFRQLETLSKPSIAAVNGFAFGGGCELAMAAHLRIANDKAQFGQPEIKLGVLPGYGGTQRLARLVGKGRALDLCLTGRFISATEALNWGLVTQVTSPESLLTQAENTLSTVVSMAPLAIQSIIEVLNQGYDMSLDQALHLEAVHFAKICATQDKQEGVNAFLAKREAKFKGE